GLHVKDADYVWGLATRDLLGGVGFGLVGLMVACLIAAMMASMSAHQMCVAALITRNLYVPIVRQFRKPQTVLVGTTEHPEVHEPGIGDTRADAPDDPNAGLSERHMIWMGRLFGIFYVAGAVAIATTFNSVFGLLKFLTMFNSIVAAAFWLGMLWRRANRIGAWASMILTFTIMLLLPFTLPLIPGVRTNSYLLKRTDQPPVSRVYTARQADVDQRSISIVEWNSQTAHGQSAGPRPKPLVAGEKFEKWYKFPPRSIFWGGDIALVNGHDEGQGWLKVELVILDKLGWDLSRNSYSFNETLSMLMRLVVPFGTLMLVSLLTPREDQHRLDLFFVKMKTKVEPDPAADARAMELSYAQPHRFDHVKLFPRSNWEFRKWEWDDLKGVIGTLIAAGGCVLLLWLMVTLGR
ncbi:MAG TPA: hypothetical protein VGF52_03725, partial [Tepidisphaeraceae bacterium]